MKRILFILLVFCSLNGRSQSYTNAQYQRDFEYFWTSLNDNYCYFHTKQVDWQQVKALYSPRIDTVHSRSSFVGILEQVLYELYDHHCSLNTNTALSRRLVPTGADVWATYIHGKPTIVEVRKDFGAEMAGVKAGMEVIAINDLPVEKAILPFLAHTADPEAKNFALRLALAGDHLSARKFTLRFAGKTADYYPDKNGLLLENIHYKEQVSAARFGSVAYIRVNNFLFDQDLIGRFDSVLNRHLASKSLILDLRETPSGGNSSVARAILGRFITKEQFYQKHELFAEEKETGVKRSWEEIVSPRGIPFTGKLIVLADHWTGSMGEGIVAGFAGMKRATVIGTEMARLNGAVETFEMPETKIRFNFPTERLYLVNGLPREQFEPNFTIAAEKQTAGTDAALQKARALLPGKLKK